MTERRTPPPVAPRERRTRSPMVPPPLPPPPPPPPPVYAEVKRPSRIPRPPAEQGRGEIGDHPALPPNICR